MCSRMTHLCNSQCSFTPNFSVIHDGSVGARRTQGNQRPLHYQDPMKAGLKCCQMCQNVPEGETKNIFEIKKEAFLAGDEMVHHTPCFECPENDRCKDQAAAGLLDH